MNFDSYVRRVLRSLLAASLVASGISVYAQLASSRPVTIVVPFPAGGTPDLAARLLSQGMSIALNQPSTLRHVWVVPMDDLNTVEWEVLFAPFDDDGRPTQFKYDADPALYDMPRPVPYAEYIRPGADAYPDYAKGGARGATVILRQDTQIQSSQGVIQPREHEHLATSDRGVIKLRRIIKECIDAVARGDDPRGVFRTPPPDGVIHVEVAETIVSEDEYRQLLEHESLDAARSERGATEKAA